MFVIKYRKLFITISALLVAASIGFVVAFGLPLGIDFKGGSALEYTFETNRPTLQELETTLANVGFGDALVQPVGERGVMVKSRELTESERASLVAALAAKGAGEQVSFTAIGPSVGAEITRKSIIAIALVLLSIICFVAYAFRKVSRPVSSWKYGLAVILALFHDVVIVVGAFALLAHIRGVEADTLLVVAILTTLALSISDTIVVFDRVREHLHAQKEPKPFDELVGESLRETFVRSINTSIMVLVMIIALALVGPESTKFFATLLAIGMFFGIYSSIFLASPLLVSMEKLQKK